MSPPIYTPDGTEVSEIVLPDGSTASEVIGPDGNVVFEAGGDIPDSVVWQTPYDEGSGTTTADIIADADGIISGAAWTSSENTVGGEYLAFDGVDDEVNYGTPSVLDLDPQGTWTIEIAVRNSNVDTFEAAFAKTATVTNDRQFSVEVTSSNNYRIVVGGQYATSSTSPSGNWEIVHLRNNSGTVDMLVDTTEIISDHSAGTAINANDVKAGNWSTGTESPWSGDIDSLVVHDSALSDSEINDRVSAYSNWI